MSRATLTALLVPPQLHVMAVPPYADFRYSAVLEREHFVGFHPPLRQLAHGTNLNALHERELFQPACLSACPAGFHLSPLTDDRFEHPFDVVVALRRRLCRQGGSHGVGHQEDTDFRIGVLLLQLHREPERVVQLLRAVGGIVDDQQDFHRLPPGKNLASRPQNSYRIANARLSFASNWPKNVVGRRPPKIFPVAETHRSSLMLYRISGIR